MTDDLDLRPGHDPRHHLWRADTLSGDLRAEFDLAVTQHDHRAARRAFFVLARYSRQTIGMLRSAGEHGDDELAAVTLANLHVLHETARAMRRDAPELVPDPVLLTHAARDHALDDLVVETLDAVAHPLSAERLAARLAGGGRDGSQMRQALVPHLEALEHTGHLRRDRDGRYVRTARGHNGVDRDRVGLTVLAGPTVLAALSEASIHGLRDFAARTDEAIAIVADATGWTPETAATFVSLAQELSEEFRRAGPGRPGDLQQADHVRRYQRDAWHHLRQGGYGGLVIDAPAGSGKTLMGLLCIADWLPTLAAGQSILVVVPTLNVAQQWVRELCFSPLGLRLAPHLVAIGSASVSRTTHRHRGHQERPVRIVTYAALATAGGRRGRGGFNRDDIEAFLQGRDVQYIVLDEVHKVVENPTSVIGEVTRLFADWLDDGSLRGVVGFSATAALHADRLARLGLTVTWTVDEAELVRSGFVAPSAAATVTFSRSAREQQARVAARAYRRALRLLLHELGTDRLREWFSAIPLEQRLDLARHVLRLPAAGAEGERRLIDRLQGFTEPGPFRMRELPLVWLLQLTRGWSDSDLLDRAVAATGDEELRRRGGLLLDELHVIRSELAGLAGRPDVRQRIEAPGFGAELPAATLEAIGDSREHPSVRFVSGRDALARTAAGMITSLRDEFRAVGEGRITALHAIVTAERSSRIVPSVIVFERGGALVPVDGVATPGWRGAAGSFAGLLADPSITPMAVLPHELYLPHRAERPLSTAIATLVRSDVIGGGLCDLLAEMCTVGLGVGPRHRAALRSEIASRLGTMIASLSLGDIVRADELHREVFAPVRRWARTEDLAGNAVIIGERLSRRDPQLRHWAALVTAYSAVAAAFDRPTNVLVRLTDNRSLPVEIVHFPGGQRRSLAYDIVARAVDTAVPGGDGAALVDVVIVSSWARTGWDVRAPNVLIDATATRSPIAWRQLRGRALRQWPTWDADCRHRLSTLLAGEQGPATAEASSLLLEKGKVSHLYALIPAAARHRPNGHSRADEVQLLDATALQSAATPDLRDRLAHALQGVDSAVVGAWLTRH